ncbi:transcription elongation factor SPT5 [Coprinopsis cinerea okayama7|uniref:Transcription elongation factor SPT5 n=1 Tax=Coprinopsis cinerea (strain Okayama-7 / 130 / ATCC MYA-4618 / FGSC 9003) TaxID=240176 RepID=A8P0K4_COPC7|nr:transcription elongation factor SPT5 [Coprinopsis cinerea okayama7\|eukprot:XP_001837913.2 transcription elongation factor SPT5 [Coprinopsis cinerea okayama7\
MSDYDDDDMNFGGEHEEQEEEQVSRKGKERVRDDEEEEEEQPEEYDEEEDEEEDDDEDEEEEEEVGRKGKKRQKLRPAQRHKRNPLSRFLDVEAEVSDEEEEEDEDDEGAEAFIDTFDDDEVNDDLSRRHHALLDNRRQFDEEDKSPEQIAKAFQDRYRGRPAPRYTGDLNEVPQRLLMPSVHDASLWQVRVKAGRERDIIFSLMRKSIDMEYTAHPLSILSAFQRDSLPGMIYVEARSAKMVQQACNGLVGVYLSRGIHLVPIEEMASLLTIKKQDLTVQPGTWVRIRRGKYQGDLAQVMDITENGEDVGLRFIPRVDLSPRDENAAVDASKKRKKSAVTGGATRPPQKLFNYEEVVKVWGRKNVHKRGNTYIFQNDTYRDGFIEKDFKLSALILEDVNPTLDEITQFMRRPEGADADSVVDLSVIAEASKKAAIAVLQPGDHVEVFEGEQAGVHGIVDEIHNEIVTLTVVGADIEGQKVEIPARSVRKRFKPGDHVKVMQGQNVDETGLVVSVADNVVTFLSDMSMQEVSVFSKDLREAAEVGAGTNTVGNYELHDLVQLDAQTVGVIYKTERDSFRVLDQNGQTRLVQPHQISMRRDTRRAIASDHHGHELRVNDNVKEVDGEQRKGRVLHTHQSFFAFLHNRDISENGGVFVTRARSLVSLAPKGNSMLKNNLDLSKMNPNIAQPIGGMVGSGAMGRGPRDRHIGLTVMVVKGPHKGYAGTIKDTNGNIARVELRTGNKVITVDKDKLRKMGPDKKLYQLNDHAPAGANNSSWGAPPAWTGSGAAASGGRTPFGGSSKTPNPYAVGDGRTPAWSASSRTPNPYAEGHKTPAWNASSRTPNPYADGGRTPAWNVSSRTPNPYATGANAGSATPGRPSFGGATPGRPAFGGATPARPSWGDSSWGSGNDGFSSPRPAHSWSDWSAPTPAAAPTPGLHTAQTPAFGAPTPAAATPAGVFNSAASSATPAASGGYALNDHNPDTLDSEWLFDPAVVPHHARIKIQLTGTQSAQYLGGEYEGRRGRVIAGTKAPSGYEQTATVLFESGEQRSVVARFISPVPPSQNDEEVLIAGGRHKGQLMIVREDPHDETVTVSSRSNPAAVVAVPKELLIALYDEN